jgi:hypothetical protein
METWAVDEPATGRYWNGDEAAHWLVHEERYEPMLARSPTPAGLGQAMAVKRAVIAAVVDQVGHPGARPAPTTPARRTHRHRIPTPLPRATASTSRNAAREIEALLQDAGYTKTRTETLHLDPPVVCILAVNPDRARDRSSPASDPTSGG